MAYDPKNLSLIVAGGVAGGGIKFYSYKTTVDNLAAVLAAGYFARAEDAGLKEQDIIFVVLSDDTIVTLTVTGFTAAGAAIVEETIEDGLDGLFSNTYVAKTTTASIVNGDKGKTISLAGNACYTLTYGAASTYDDNFGNIVINSDSGRAKFISLNGVVHKLWPGQRATILNVNDVWKIQKPDRWKLTTETVFYVDAAAGIDSTNDGLAAGAGGAWANEMLLFTHIAQNIDVSGDFNLIMELADGTYTQGFHLASPLIGRDGGQNFVIRGENTTGTIVSPATAAAVGAFTGQTVYLQNMRLESGTGNGIETAQAADVVYIDDNIVFGDCGGTHISATDGTVIVAKNYSIDGNAGACHHLVGAKGLISGAGKTVTLLKNITVGTSFAGASNGGVLSTTGFTWSLGAFSVTGPRFLISVGGIIAPGTSSLTYYPGSTAGINSGGIYHNSLPGTNTWDGVQTFVGGSGFPVLYQFTDDGTSGPQTISQHISASPAANDTVFAHLMQGKDSGGTTTTYASFKTRIVDPTDTSEDAAFEISTIVAGALSVRASVGGGLWMAGATGTDKGAGTINATAVYDDNVLLTDLVLDMAVTGSFDKDRYASHPIADEVSAGWFDLDTYAAYWQEHRSLAGMRSWTDEADKPPTGEVITRLTAVVENQAVLIEVLNQRLKALEA